MAGIYSGVNAVVRGGGWETAATYCRNSNRGLRLRYNSFNDGGFRVVRIR